MATLYDETGAVVASGFTVLRDSRLTQRRTDVVHDTVTGGLPYVVRKGPAGLAGNLEFLCPTAEMADAIYAAHLGGRLRLDNWQRQNIATNPHAATATRWGWSSGIGGAVDLTTETGTDTPDSRPGFRRATITTADTGGSSGHYYRQDGTEDGQPGDVVPMSMYVRSSVADTFRLSTQIRAGGAALPGTVQGPDLAVPANTWTRLSATLKAGVDYDGFQAWAVNPTSGPPAGSTIDATMALIGADGPYFDGATLPDSGHVNAWSGPADNSVSHQYERPRVDVTYLPVGGVGIPVRGSRNYWRVSVPSIQEVAP